MTFGGNVSDLNSEQLDYEQWFKLHDYSDLLAHIKSEGLTKWFAHLNKRLPELFNLRHGQYEQWFKSVNSLPKVANSNYQINEGYLKVDNLFVDEQVINIEQFKQNLRALIPWRKGPYELNQIKIDTEWRSDYKWDRLKEHISPLKNRSVLDVGCGNGYHCWRMYDAGAKIVLGIDPSWLFLAQFQVIKQLMGKSPVYLLPMGIEEMPNNYILGDFGAFDTIFSMGVLYHRRSPLDHLFQLKHLLHSRGELVLETLIIDGEEGEALLPKDRYAKMRNVWFLPTIKTLESWMERCGFINIRVISVEKTSIQEQHKTDWVPSESLEDFLDPFDDSKTVEGYPAPKRVVILANKP